MNFEVTPISSAASANWAVSPQQEESLGAEEEAASVQAAYDMAIRMLASRAMSSGRLRERLVQREVERGNAESVVHRIVEEGYLNDREYAIAQIERLRERKKLGGAALRQELAKLGVPAADADAALQDRPAEEDTDLALQAAMERAPRLRGLERQAAERRLLGYLQRRGHGGSAAMHAVRTALDEAASPRKRVSFN